MMESIENDVRKELLGLVKIFEDLSGESKLDFVKIVIEKLENGEIEVNGKEVTSNDIGIEDGYACCRSIVKIIKNS